MKILNLVVFSCFCAHVFAQNSFPSSGNVGIGTSSPQVALDIQVGGLNSAAKMTTNDAEMTFTRHTFDMKSRPGFSYVPYISWNTNNGTRQAYLGWRSDVFNLTLENGFNFSINGGNVGIGTTTPVGKLDINHAGGQLRLSGGAVAAGVWTDANQSLYLADWDSGTKGIKINMSNGSVSIGGSTGADIGYGSSLDFLGASSNGDGLWMARYNNGSNKSELRVNIGDDYGQAEDMFVVGTHHWNGGAWFPHLAVQAGGRVGIGTTTPDAALTVKGDIHTREVKVDLAGAVGPDYVFEKDYNLTSLEELKSYIDQNKHLPEIPSAKEMEEEGINLKEMNLLLLKKIEELTLYVIEQNEELILQSKLIKDQNARLSKLENSERQ